MARGQRIGRTWALAALVAAAGWTTAALAQQAPPVTPGRSGDYLGETPPGEVPKLFAPGLVCTGRFERDIAMTPDGGEIYFGAAGAGYAYTTILVVRRLPDGRWTEPAPASFVAAYPAHDLEPHVSPDGRRVYFLSDRPSVAGGEYGNSDIWVADRAGDGWGEPYNLGAPVNTEDQEYFPSLTRDGTLYFTRQKKGERPNAIYRARWVDGRYAEPERLPEQVNSGATRFNAFIAPDESYLLLSVMGRPDAIGATDYYVCFRSPDDTWSEPVNLGERINVKDGQGYSPYVSPDGKYLFFMSSRRTAVEALTGRAPTLEDLRVLQDSPQNGNPDIYWVEADFLEGLRPR